MFEWAVVVGIYSYIVFFLGIVGKLTLTNLFVVTVIFLLLTAWLLWKKIDWDAFFSLWTTWPNRILIGLLVLQLLINIFGALGPELGFDAIWYHLTIPRIWLMEERIFFINHSPFGYSLLPKVIELLYLPALAFSNETAAKLIHCLFGFLCLIVTYKLGRVLLSRTHALLAAVVFYSNLVVGWQSITAYIDLGRTFFEGLALLAFCYYLKDKKEQWFWWCAVLLGLAITSKLIAVGSLSIFAVLLLQQKQFKKIVILGIVSILIPLPWLIANYLATGNPVTPIFAGYDLSSTRSVWDFLTIWLQAADPVSPFYLVILPVLVISLFSWSSIFLHKIKENYKSFYGVVVTYSVVALFVWWITPRTGGGRFLLPYLPAFSVASIAVMSRIKDTVIQQILIGSIILLSGIAIGFRSLANAQYLPVLLSKESKSAFLQRKLDFSFSDNVYYLTDKSLRQVYKQESSGAPLEWDLER